MAGSTCVQSALDGLDQQADLLLGQRQHVADVLNSLPLKRGSVWRSTTEKPPRSISCHSAPTSGTNCAGSSLRLFSRSVKRALRNQADILGEHAEQAAGEEAGDGFGGVAGGFERLGDLGQMRGNLARDARGLARRVERSGSSQSRRRRSRMSSSRRSASADAVAARVGKGRVGGAALA